MVLKWVTLALVVQVGLFLHHVVLLWFRLNFTGTDCSLVVQDYL